MEINFMYKLLTSMPLLQGINGMDLARIESKVKMDFVHYTSHNAPFIKQGNKSTDLLFLSNGEITRTYSHQEVPFKFTETIKAPFVIEPESLFGLTLEYKATYHTDTECDVLIMKKGDVIHTLMANDIFRINYLNSLSNIIQSQEDRLLQKDAESVRSKICRLIKNLSMNPTGEKLLEIKMIDLADHLSETRLNVSRKLNDMVNEGLVVLHRKEILIPELGNL